MSSYFAPGDSYPSSVPETDRLGARSLLRRRRTAQRQPNSWQGLATRALGAGTGRGPPLRRSLRGVGGLAWVGAPP